MHTAACLHTHILLHANPHLSCSQPQSLNQDNAIPIPEGWPVSTYHAGLVAYMAKRNMACLHGRCYIPGIHTRHPYMARTRYMTCLHVPLTLPWHAAHALKHMDCCTCRPIRHMTTCSCLCASLYNSAFTATNIMHCAFHDELHKPCYAHGTCLGSSHSQWSLPVAAVYKPKF